MTHRDPIVKVYCADGTWQQLSWEEYEATKNQWMGVQIMLPYVVSAKALRDALSSSGDKP